MMIQKFKCTYAATGIISITDNGSNVGMLLTIKSKLVSALAVDTINAGTVKTGNGVTGMKEMEQLMDHG